MRKILIQVFMAFSLLVIFMPINKCYCEENIINPQLEGKLVELKENQLKSLQDYSKAYGSDAFGLVAYILNVVRIYSIPFCFIGIVIGAIKQYVLGVRKLDVLEHGMLIILSSVTVLTICQVLPLIFAVVVKFGKG